LSKNHDACQRPKEHRAVPVFIALIFPAIETLPASKTTPLESIGFQSRK
jgi:hypothetical protein